MREFYDDYRTDYERTARSLMARAAGYAVALLVTMAAVFVIAWWWA